MNYQQTWLHLPPSAPEPGRHLPSAWLVGGLLVAAVLATTVLLLLP